MRKSTTACVAVKAHQHGTNHQPDNKPHRAITKAFPSQDRSSESFWRAVEAEEARRGNRRAEARANGRQGDEIPKSKGRKRLMWALARTIRCPQELKREKAAFEALIKRLERTQRPDIVDETMEEIAIHLTERLARARGLAR